MPRYFATAVNKCSSCCQAFGLWPLAVFMTLGASQAWGQCTEQQKLTALDFQFSDFFGYSVSVSGDTAVVGAYLDDVAGEFDAGSAYVFVRTAGVWTQQQKLTASDASQLDYFGSSVSVSGDTAVIGAYQDDLNGAEAGSVHGSAYVFVRTGTVWTQQQKLTATVPTTQDWFGFSVSVDGDIAVIGAHQDFNINSGSAYVFVRTGGVWTLQQRLTAPDAVFNARFGRGVSVSGQTVVVGADQDDAPANNSGSAYVFVRAGTVWTQQQKLTASDATISDHFGVSVSVSGDTAVIGAENVDVGPFLFAGSAFVFVRTGGVWTEQQKLNASDATQGASFGHAVSVSGDTAAVGLRVSVGSAYAFVRAGAAWTEQQLAASPAAFFSDSVSVSGGTVMAGSFGSESAYVFQCGTPSCSPPDCSNHGTCNNGTCACDAGFAGGGCDQCAPGFENYPTGTAAPNHPPTKDADDTCIGGANAGLGCAQNSDCPGGFCQLKNRFITTVIPSTAVAHGLKVNLVNIDANSVATPANYNGTDRWAGAPSLPISDGVSPSFIAGQLQCTFLSTDWSAVGQLHMYGDVVVPASTYDVSVCASEGGPCSTALRIGTAKFGDVVTPTNTVNFQDVTSIVAKFQGTPAGPSKTRTKLTGSIVNPSNPINFQEVSACVSAFQSKAFKSVVPLPPATCP